MVYNSKFGASRKIINPMGLINDSQFELIYLRNKIKFDQVNKFYEGADCGGVQANF